MVKHNSMIEDKGIDNDITESFMLKITNKIVMNDCYNYFNELNKK